MTGRGWDIYGPTPTKILGGMDKVSYWRKLTEGLKSECLSEGHCVDFESMPANFYVACERGEVIR